MALEQIVTIPTSGREQKRKRKEDSQRDLSAFLTSGKSLLPERVRLIEEAYKVKPYGKLDNSLLENCLTLLDVPPQEKELLAISLSKKSLDYPLLKRGWTECFLHSNTLTALSLHGNDQPKRLVEVVEQYSQKDETIISKPGLLGEVFFQLGIAMKQHLLNSGYPLLEEQLAPLTGKEFKYLSPEREIALRFPPSPSPRSYHKRGTDSRTSTIEYLLNFFIAAYDLYDPQANRSRDKERRTFVSEYFPGSVYLELGKFMRLRPDLLFLTEFAPELKMTRELLSERLSLSNGNNLLQECFLKAQDFFRRMAEGPKEKNNEGNQSRKSESDHAYFMSRYTEASFYLSKDALDQINWDSLEELLSRWHLPENQPVRIYSYYVSLELELAKLNKSDKAKRVSALKQVILSANRAKRGQRENESMALIDQALIEAREYASQWGDTEDIDPALEGANQGVLLNQAQPAGSRSLKAGVVSIPVDRLGLLMQGLVRKVGPFQKMEEEYFSQQEIYKHLQEGLTTPGHPKVLFVRPLRLQTMEKPENLSYFMKRSGKVLSQKIRLLNWQRRYLLKNQNEFVPEERVKIRSREKEILQQEFGEIRSALHGLAQFQGVLSPQLGSVLSGNIEISAPTGEIVATKAMESHIDSFGYLENLIERAFVKSDNPESGRMVENLSDIVRNGNKEAFMKLEKRDYFSSRIPYSPAVYNFLIEYHSFIGQQLVLSPIPKVKMVYNRNGGGGVQCFINEQQSTPAIEVILHGDAHLNNFLEGGTIIDNKPLKRGHPFTDLAHLLEHPNLDFFTPEERRELIGGYVTELSAFYGAKINLEELIGRDYLPHVVHIAVCQIGAKLNQGNIKEAKYYLRKAQTAMRELSLESLLHAFKKMIMGTGRSDLMDEVAGNYATPVKRDFQYGGIKIGIDFDGVIADSTSLKIEYAKTHYEIELSPEQGTLDKSQKAGLTEAQYKEMTRKIHSTELCLRMEIVPGAKEALQNLLKVGCEAYIVTSRGGEEVERAKEWLAKNKMPYTGLVGVNEQAKLDACRKNELTIFFDNSKDKLVPLSTQGIELYLFSTVQNSEEKIELKDARRLSGWNGIYTVINNHVETRAAKNNPPSVPSGLNPRR